MEREFDIVIFGASGFTGKLVVQEMAKKVPQLNLKWAVAGRCSRKVQQILTEVERRTSADLTNIRIFEADVTDQNSLDLMCQSTRLIINCVGPYAKYGEPVIKACLKHKTHIVDMAIELSYIHDIITKYFREAESREVYIITTCGIGYLFFEMAIPILEKKFEGGIDKIDVHIKGDIKRRSVHFGTWQSFMNMCNGVYEVVVARQKMNLEIMQKPRSKWSILSLSCPLKYIREVKGLSFYLPSILHTANIGLDMRQGASSEKQPLKLTYYYVVDSALMLLLWTMRAISVVCLHPFPVGRRLLTNHPGFFSCGLVKKSTLSEETNDVTVLNFVAVARGWNHQHHTPKPDKKVVLHGSGPAGYQCSAICSVQAAFTVLQEIDNLPSKGGIYTSIGAFSETSLPMRLQNNGIKYEEKEQELWK